MARQKRSQAKARRSAARPRGRARAGSAFDGTPPPLVDLIRAFLDRRQTLSAASAATLREGLQPWVSFLRTYRKSLESRTVSESPEDQLREVARALLSSYLDFFKAHPERGRGFITLQAQLLDAYLEALEVGLRRAGRAERASPRKRR